MSKTISVPEHAALVTAPAATTSGKVRIAFGSCFHRWGLGNPKQADLILIRNSSAMLLLGYIAVQDGKTIRDCIVPTTSTESPTSMRSANSLSMPTCRIPK